MKKLFKLFKRLFVKKCQCIDFYGQEEDLEEYSVQDDTWPSRRWNKERTDYIDLSGHNHHDGCPICDMPFEHLYTNKNETVYACECTVDIEES